MRAPVSRRLAQLANHPTPGQTWALLGGLLYDGQPEDTLPAIPPLSGAILVLAAVGFVFAIIRAVRTRGRAVSPFALMLISCVPLFFVIPSIIDTRVIAVFLPLIALAATGLIDLLGLTQTRRARFALAGVALVTVLGTSIYAAAIYFSPTYTSYASDEFYPGFGTAIRTATHLSGDSELYVSQFPQLSYMQVLWYDDISSRTFQASQPTPADPDFGRFVFARKRIDRTVPYYYLISRKYDQPVCSNPTVVWTRGEWSIGRCA